MITILTPEQINLVIRLLCLAGIKLFEMRQALWSLYSDIIIPLQTTIAQKESDIYARRNLYQNMYYYGLCMAKKLVEY